MSSSADAHQSDAPFSRSRYMALLAACVNTLLTAAKFALAYFSGSLALLAEAVHSLADIVTSLAVYLAIRLDAHVSAKAEREREAQTTPEQSAPEQATPEQAPPSRLRRLLRFLSANPQGRIARLIGLFLMTGALSLFARVFTVTPYQVQNAAPFALAMLGLAVLSFLLSRLEFYVGRKEGARALVADAYHASVDMWAAVFVALALYGESMGFAVDGVAALVISVVVFFQGLALFRTLSRADEDDQAPGTAACHWLPGLLLRFCPERTACLTRLLARLLRVAPGQEFQARLTRRALHALLVLLVLAYAASGLFIVQAHERAVIERLGVPLSRQAALEPGLHLALPWPLDTVRRVDATTIRRLVVGTEVSPESTVLLWTNTHFVREYNLLSGENIFTDTGLVLQYRVADALAYLYGARDPERILEQLAYSVLTEVMARTSFFDLVTDKRAEVERTIQNRLRGELARYPTGLQLTAVSLRDIHPPMDVAPAFEDVVGASVDYEAFINMAKGEYEDTVSTARGEAAVALEEARGKSVDLVLTTRGDAARFAANHAGYLLAPEVYAAERRLTQARNFLPLRDKYVLPGGLAQGQIDLFLDLNY